MWASWEPLLTSQGADEDAARFFVALGDVFRSILMDYLVRPKIILEADSAVLDIEENVFGSLSSEFPQKFVRAFGNVKVNLRGTFAASLRNVYAYIRDEHPKTRLDEEYEEILECYCRLLWLLFPTFFSKQRTDRERGIDFSKFEITFRHEDVLAAAVSPRFSNAIKMYRLRREIVAGFESGKEKEESISSTDLAFLASVSYPYVAKLIRSGKLAAHKKENGKLWYIPLYEAVAFTTSRSTAPVWVKKLAGS